MTDHAPLPASAPEPSNAALAEPPEIEEAPFWRRKTLAEMNSAEWESLCDGCGRCCLLKLIDEDTDQVLYTDVGCRLLDSASGHCRHYPDRQRHVPDCIQLTPDAVPTLAWLPPTCGYRLVAEGQDLEWWHPLVSGDPRTVRWAGISVAGRIVEEPTVPEERLPERIVDWPLRGAW